MFLSKGQIFGWDSALTCTAANNQKVSISIFTSSKLLDDIIITIKFASVVRVDAYVSW